MLGLGLVALPTPSQAKNLKEIAGSNSKHRGARASALF